MSPVATGGPHTRASSVNGGGPVSSANGGKTNGIEGMKGANRVFPHLDDLVAARPEVDIHSSIRRILQEGELFAKQADTHFDFHRPELALQEYVKASIVAVEIIPRHKEYPSLQSDRGELHRLYNSLNKRINAQHPKFAEVKKIIQENNARSGVKPTVAGASPVLVSLHKANGTQNGHSRSQSVQSPSNGIANGAAPRKKPPIQPKPDALHGNAIQSSGGKSDLAARFARLRSADSNGAGQDPRIRTRPISIPGSPDLALSSGKYTTMSRPSGPREMPSVLATLPHPTKLPLNTNIPGMPRAPDAIYSPARNTDTTATANLPSSVPRSASYLGNSKHGAAPPISTVGPTPGIADHRQDYFSPAHTVENRPRSPEKRRFDLPDSATVTAEDLMEYLKLGSHTLRVLLVDLRSREDFENGHIMSHSIICVEPITLRQGISGEQLGDSMVIAPDYEQDLYEQRDEFDLIVFYDQSSSSTKSSGGPGSEGALLHFPKAVYDYGYEKRLKQRPMLLVGGLDAWVDLLGPNSLKASFVGTSLPGQKAGTPLSRVPLARDPLKTPLKRRKTHSSRPLSKEEEKIWDQKLREDASLRKSTNDEGSVPEELVYARTTEDFFRRYPELPAIQESMILPVPSPRPIQSYHDQLYTPLPPPPARPAPALPRQRSSGLSEKGPTATFAHSSGWGAQSITRKSVPPGLTGLSNPGVLCYMNAAIQGLSATKFLREFLTQYKYPPDIRIPRKSSETTDPPQLMVRSFGNLIGHLWSGQYDFVTPKTFAGYVNTVHAGKMIDEKVRSMAYGGSLRQHDSAEFLNFLLEILDDELNPKRNVPTLRENDPQLERRLNELPLLSACELAWRHVLETDASPITMQMKGQYVFVTTCRQCKKDSRTFMSFPFLTLNIADTKTQTIADAIRNEWGSTEEVDYKCDHCKTEDAKADRVTYLAYLPNYLIIQLNRYDNALRKVRTAVTFPENGIDLTPAFLPPSADAPKTSNHERKRPFLYDCYAVIMHKGAGITSGHYTTLVKTGSAGGNVWGGGVAPSMWTQFNDSNIRPLAFSNAQNNSNVGEALVLFLKRQGVP